jgi:hypothetical protein
MSGWDVVFVGEALGSRDPNKQIKEQIYSRVRIVAEWILTLGFSPRKGPGSTVSRRDRGPT